MEAHGPAEYQGSEDIAFDLLDEHDHAEDEKGVARTSAHQGDERRHRPGHDGAYQGEESAEERQHHQREHQGDTDDQQANPDDHRIDHCHQRRAAHVAPDDAPHPPAEGADQVSMLLPYLAQREGAHLGAVLHEEEDQHHDQQQPGEHLASEDGAGQHPRGDASTARAQLLERLVAVAVDLVPRQLQRALHQPRLDLVDALRQGGAEVLELLGHRGRGQDHNADERAQRGQQHQPRGQ